MAQVTIYLDKETKEKIQAYTKSKEISTSQWITSLIREKLQNEWPDGVIALAGAWKDFPTAEEIRADVGKDIERETL
ncbi:MAG: hypothetical protein JXA42_27115 [Anaerolineales bacterium]|nr:hypothetical protein [Anaerolineales bacterium]